jgi:hypothetical protein
MKLIDQMAYRSDHAWRPQPSIISEEAIGFLGVCFSWGEMDLSSKVLENVRFYIEACLNQSEITNPFGYQESLTGLENALRSGIMLANDVIYRLVNKVSLSGGVECALLAKRGRELAILQIGQPHIFLKRDQQIIPIETALDLLPTDLGSGAFIPNRLLGVNSTCSPHVRSVHFEKGDEILLVAHSLVPKALFQSAKSDADARLKSLFQGIVKESPQCPFWISTIKL